MRVSQQACRCELIRLACQQGILGNRERKGEAMQPERLGSPKLSCQSTGRTWPLCNPFRQVPGLAARGRVHSRSVDFIGTAKWNPIPTCKETRCVCVVVAKLLLPCWAVGTRSDPRAREWKQLPTPRPVEGGEMLTAGDSPTSTPQ